MEKAPSSENIQERKATFERWKQELSDRETAFLKTKDSVRRMLEESRKELEMLTEILERVFKENWSDIEENEKVLKAELEKPFEEADFDLISTYQSILETDYETAQKAQDMLIELQTKSHSIEERIDALEQESKNSQQEE